MAINDEWEYTRTQAGLEYTVFFVSLYHGEAKARASFLHRVDAEQYAEMLDNSNSQGPGWGIAVERNRDGFVTWTSF